MVFFWLTLYASACVYCEGFYHYSVLSGCPVSRVVVFDWKANIEFLAEENVIAYDCYSSNKTLPCVNYIQGVQIPALSSHSARVNVKLRYTAQRKG